MRSHFLIPIIFVTAVAAVISCGDSGTNTNNPPVGIDSRLALTPRENAEAEWAALWLSDALVAPETLYLQIRSDLARVRAVYLDSFPEIRSIEFIPHGYPTSIWLQVTDSVVAAVRAGQYHAWDSLNQLYGVESIDTLYLYSISRSIVLEFSKRLNSDSVATCYAALPGIIRCVGGDSGGDYSNVYPWKTAERRTYLWREGKMDCPAGCVQERFWYFRLTDSSTEYVGSFYRDWMYELPAPPTWWEEAKAAYCAYRRIPDSVCQ